MKHSAQTRRRVAMPLIVAIAATATVTTLASNALFSDSVVSATQSVTTSTVNINASPASAVLTMSAMMPGDVKVAPLTLNNAGGTQLRYAATSTFTNTDGKGLAAALNLSVKIGVTTCTEAGFDATGGAWYIGSLAGFAQGNPAQGGQAGDRAINAGASETLCMKVTLPSNAANSLQTATTTATFTFPAEQTANN